MRSDRSEFTLERVDRDTVALLDPVLREALASIPPDWHWTYDEVVRMAGDCCGYVLALTVRGRPAGYLMAQLVWDPRSQVLIGMVHHNYVARPYRGATRGFWLRAQAMVEVWARGRGARLLGCLAYPRWSRILQRLGWEYRGTLPQGDYLVWPVRSSDGH